MMLQIGGNAAVAKTWDAKLNANGDTQCSNIWQVHTDVKKAHIGETKWVRSVQRRAVGRCSLELPVFMNI